MSKRFTRTEILARLQAQIDAKQSILVVGAGNGLVARCAEQSGADLLVVYNSGYYRLHGHPSMVGNLPIGDANEIMLRLGERGVIPTTKDMPVIGGAFGVDPTRDMNRLLAQMSEVGFSGIINFPTVGRIDGQYRRDLESAGLGFACEANMVQRARAKDMFTMAYVYSVDDTTIMVNAGVDVIVGHCGLTAGGDVGSRNAMPLDNAVETLRGLFGAAKSLRNDIILLSHGGPIATPEDAEYVNFHTDAVGFVAASSIERIPIEETLKTACRRFKSIKVKQ
jgi:predicted TIM-barrel enzyme